MNKFKVGDRVQRPSDVFGKVGENGVRMMHGTIVEIYSSTCVVGCHHPELYRVQWDDGPVGKGYLPHGIDPEQSAGRTQANRAYNPPLYDHFFNLGQMAAKAGEERTSPTTFQYEYAAGCWFDGYDSVKEKAE